jgi:serine/threonine-protein kinase
MATTPQVLIDRYEVGRLLGSGGMAEVFEGRDRLLARRVAIKVLLAQYARDPAFLVRFKREAQAAASLSHPNIVAVYDTGAEAATQFIVMEYVEGRTLRQVLRAEGRLLPERAAEIAVAVCGALSAAHARGLVHRDIKPGNVMLTPSGGVKVMDFGIARAVAAESVTQTSAVVGTAQYLSPEQAQGLGVDGRSDVYGLGCCVYEMVTGVVPFSGSSPVAIAYRHVREAPRPPRVVNPEVPVGVEAVVLRAMAKRPEDRYQTAAEFRDDLERFLAGHHVLATPPLSEQTTQAISRAPADAATAATAAMTAGTAAATAAATAAGAPAPEQDGTAGGGEPGPEPDRDEAATSLLSAARGRAAAGGRRVSRRPRRGVPAWVAGMAAVLLLAVPVAFFMVRSIGGVGAPTRTTLAPVAVPGTDPLDAFPPVTTRPPPSTTAPTTTVPATTRTAATATTNATGTSGPALLQVPRVVGQRVARATEVLIQAGFSVRRVEVPVGQRSRVGRVLAQAPNAGAEVPAGSEVQIAVGVQS